MTVGAHGRAALYSFSGGNGRVGDRGHADGLPPDHLASLGAANVGASNGGGVRLDGRGEDTESQGGKDKDLSTESYHFNDVVWGVGGWVFERCMVGSERLG